MKKMRITLGEYVGHLVIGAGMFCALLLFGGGLNKLVHWATPMIGDESFSKLMEWVEKTILVGDTIFIVWWAMYSTYKAIREMMSSTDDNHHGE